MNTDIYIETEPPNIAESNRKTAYELTRRAAKLYEFILFLSNDYSLNLGVEEEFTAKQKALAQVWLPKLTEQLDKLMDDICKRYQIYKSQSKS